METCHFCGTAPNVGGQSCASREQAESCAWFTPRDRANYDRIASIKSHAQFLIDKDAEIERLRGVLEDIVDIQLDIPPEDLLANVKASAAYALWGGAAAENIAKRANQQSKETCLSG